MTRRIGPTGWLLLLLIVPLYAADDGACAKCLSDSQKELMKCMEGAISEEDKKTCVEKNDQRVQSCNQLECRTSTGK